MPPNAGVPPNAAGRSAAGGPGGTPGAELPTTGLATGRRRAGEDDPNVPGDDDAPEDEDLDDDFDDGDQDLDDDRDQDLVDDRDDDLDDERRGIGRRDAGHRDPGHRDPGHRAGAPRRRRRAAAGGAAAGGSRRAANDTDDADDAEDADGAVAGAVGPTSRKDAKKAGRKGSFWRELPLLIVVAVVLTFAIQTFVARIYVIPSASMEQTLHGCSGCSNDRVAVDKLTYDFSDPQPGDVVVFRGPPSWLTNEEVASRQPSSNALVRGANDVLSMLGITEPNEKDFVKRVIAVGGQTVACCDAQNRVTVDGRPLTEPYVHIQAGTPPTQAPFDPVQVPAGQLWVMGDNRNNSADARFHGPIGVSDVIGKVRAVVLPVDRWRTVPGIDPQSTATALPAADGAGLVPAAVPVLLVAPPAARRWRLHRSGRDQDPDHEPGRDGDLEPGRDG